MRNKLFVLASLVMVLTMILTACATPAPQVIVQTQVVEKVSTQVVEKSVEKVVTATPVPPTAAPTKAPTKASDTVVIAMQQEPDTLHPLIGSMMARTLVLLAMFPGCMSQNDKAEWIPLGCETIPTVDNGGAKLVGDGKDQHLEITYKIKKDWRWTDGTPVTSKDAIYSWKLQMNPDFEAADRSAIEKIYDIKAVDDKTFVTSLMSEAQAKDAAAGTLKGNVDFAKFKQDYVDSAYDTQAGAVVDPAYWNLGWAAGTWLPEHILNKVAAKDQAASDWAKKPVSDGPYVIKEWKPGQEIILEKSDKPYPLGDPKIKTVIFRFFADTSAVISALQKGEVDVVTETGGL
ncbi:MAG TPA: ABC transporter substrate-binding protein, partial [Anaerolineae bacterium]